MATTEPSSTSQQPTATPLPSSTRPPNSHSPNSPSAMVDPNSLQTTSLARPFPSLSPSNSQKVSIVRNQEEFLFVAGRISSTRARKIESAQAVEGFCDSEADKVWIRTALVFESSYGLVFMSISSSLHLSASWSPGCSSNSAHGAASELRSSIRVTTRRGRRKRDSPRPTWKRERTWRGSVSSEEIPESAHESLTPGPQARGDALTLPQSGAARAIAPSNRRSPPLAAVSNPLFTIESTPLVERLENFDKLNWRGKLTASAVVVAALAAASFAGVKLVQKLHATLASKKEGNNNNNNNGGGSNSLAYDVVAKGFATVQDNLGPWSFSDLTLGLAAISKVTERAPPPPPGKLAKELMSNASFLARAQHWQSFAEAVYSEDPASFSLQSQLPESAIVAAEWSPCQETLRPAYTVCIDAPHGAVVLSVRGTSQIVDMLVNSGASADPFLDGQAHGGFAKATENLVKQVVPHIKRAFEEQSKFQKDLKLVITGHSMGAAVGIMAGMKLKQSGEFPNVECWGYSTPACVTLDVARGCKDFATSFIAQHDVVPRFSISNLELLRKRISDFDWDSADKIAAGDDDWSNIRSAAETLQSAQEKQKEMYKSMEQAQEGIGKQVENVNEKMGSSLREGDDKEKESEEEKKEEEKKEHPPLYPAGRLFVLACDPPGSGKLPENRSDVASGRSSGTYPTFEEVKRVKWVLHEVDQEDLKEIVVSPWCVSDHMIGYLGEGIGNLQRHCEPAFGNS